MKQPRNSCLSPKVAGLALALFGLGSLMGGAGEAQAATNAIIDGIIDRITLDAPGDHWSGGTIEVGGQRVTIPRNLLIDLPANRVTLQQLVADAPGLCPASGQTGLARADSPFCNPSGQPGYVLIHANRTNAGNIIAGDVFIQKGIEAISGTVSFINYAEGYFRLNGNPGDDTTGVMVRLNDPTARHSIQSGRGCLPGQDNCSPDPRFTNDPDNYTNVFSTGYPLCIPSTISRTFDDVLNLDLNAATTTLTTAALPDGTGDLLCPTTNRTINLGQPADDSRRFAPIMLGDSMVVEGNFERIAGVRFLSAHTTMVLHALGTKDLPDQPDYMLPDEVEVDMPAWQNERVRMLFIGFATLAPFDPINLTGGADVMVWSLHYDQANGRHELPFASVVGCDIAAGPSTCGAQGLAGVVPGNVFGANIYRIRYDIDFGVGAKARLNPCAHLLAEPRFGASATGICPGSANVDPRGFSLNLGDMIGVLSPIPHEIQARTGHEMNDLWVGGVKDGVPGPRILKNLDVSGNEATHGQYLFPFGMGLGGLAFIEFVEIDLDRIQTPFSFSGLPWLLDRRLSPGGCVGPCEGTAQPVSPFPFEEIDPRLQAVGLPNTPYNDPAYTTAPLASVRSRMFSYVDQVSGKATGDATVLPWVPANLTPAAIPITPVVDIPGANLPPLITSTPILTARAGILYTYQVTANDDAPGLIYTLGGSPPAGMAINSATGLITWTPTQAQAPAQGLTVTVTDAGGLYDKQAFVIKVNGAPSFVNVAAPTTAKVGTLYAYQPFATDPNIPGDTLTWSLISPPGGTAPLGTMNINTATGRVTWIPTVGQVGARTFSLRVTDAAGASATRTFNVNVIP